MQDAPAGSLDRIAEALRGAVPKLPSPFQSVIAELLRPDTELALEVVLGVWAGLHFSALGWLEDAIAGAKGSMGLGETGQAIDSCVARAAAAKNRDELHAATVGLSGAVTKLGAARLQAVLQADQFGQLRSAVAGLRSQLLVGSLWPASVSEAPTRPVLQPMAAANRGAGWCAVGVGTAVGLLLIGIAMAARRQG